MSRHRPELSAWSQHDHPSSNYKGQASEKNSLLIRGGTARSESEDSDHNGGWGAINHDKGIIDLLKQIFLTQYTPDPTALSFLSRAQEKEDDGIKVKVAVLGEKESRNLFGVSLDRQGVQACWVEIDNTKGTNYPLFFDRLRLDPNYFAPNEAAIMCHFASLKTMLSKGILSWMIFLPLCILLPLKLITAQGANREMTKHFCAQSFPHGLIEVGSIKRGFVFTSVEIGTKIVNVGLIKAQPDLDEKNFVFSVPVPRSTRVDYDDKEPTTQTEDIIECNEDLFKARLEMEPCAVTNRKGTQEGDPVNLVVVGDFSTLLAAFEPRWDETETTGFDSSIKTAKSFVLGSEYRYSPVSPLFLYGRSQDFALQRARGSINQRLHLRLWRSTMQFEDKPVWVGQVSRDIGVHLALIFPGTTHKIDPYVDEARDYVVTDLMKAGAVDRFAYVTGVGESTDQDPRKNLGGDYFISDGKRAVIILSPTKNTKPKLLDW